MKNRLSIICCMLALLSCSHEPTDLRMHELGIDFQAAFENDQVKLVMGGNEMLNRTLETNDLLGVCTDGGRLSYAMPEGEHSMTVTIDGTSKTETVLLNRSQFIGINYDRQTHEITFQHSDEPFRYD